MTKEFLIKKLNLSPLDIEGGMFCQVYKSTLRLDKSTFPESFKSDAYTASTSIYYMLGANDVSKMHSVASDETWHFYTSSDSGVFVELLVVSPDGKGNLVKLGSRIADGHQPQFTVPASWMMGARIASDAQDGGEHLSMNNSWALCGATVAPSFEYSDFVCGDAKKIAASCPEFSKMILELG